MCIPLLDLPEATRKKILSKAGLRVGNKVPHFSTKVKDVFNMYQENAYKAGDYETIKTEVLQAYNEARGLTSESGV
jgi:hypothetical protein